MTLTAIPAPELAGQVTSTEASLTHGPASETPMEEDARPELQRDVQRLLGRCMLRIQQYEHLLKALLANHELAGPVDTLEAQRAERAASVARLSLGQLAKAMFETYIVPEGFDRELLREEACPPDKISMALSFRLSMHPEKWTQTKTAIEDLVALRNELVHHLIERFDLWSEAGCVAASRHLDDCYQRIDHHFDELCSWAKSMDEARTMSAQLMMSPVVLDMLHNGIAPDGTFAWPDTGIVRVLREATRTLATDGWTQLERACGWITETHPEQTPAKYACRTWPQVLSESRLFELQYRFGEDGRKVAWFRQRD